jgi:hypothetical protein
MRVIFASLLVAAVATAAVPALAEPSRVEAVFELSTPEAAVEAYADAFADDDFLAVFLMLDPMAHELIERASAILRLDLFSRLDPSMMTRDHTAGANEYAFDPERPWLGPDVLQQFIYLMVMADGQDAHLVDFDGGAMSPVAADEPFTEDGRTRTWVDATVGGEGPVRFLLQQSPAGRWRILSIVARPGAPDEAVFLPTEHLRSGDSDGG